MLASLALISDTGRAGRSGMSNVSDTSVPGRAPRSLKSLCEEVERGPGGVPAGEERRRQDAEVGASDLAEERAEVGRHREVAPLEALLAREPRPASIDTAPADPAPQDEHRGRVAVVGAAVAVLADRAPELGHGEDDDVGHPVAEILREGGERPAELAQPGGELALLGTLADVGVPALHVGEGDLEPDIRLDELGDLAHRLAERAARVEGAVRRRHARRVGAPEHLHRLERLAPRARQEVAHAPGVERLE